MGYRCETVQAIGVACALKQAGPSHLHEHLGSDSHDESTLHRLGSHGGSQGTGAGDKGLRH